MAFDMRSATVLVACARAGSLGRAALALNMTQPAVSRMLRRLEDDLGVPLFERTTRGLDPTVYGQAVLPYAELVISEIGTARELVRQMQGASRGVVRIGGVGSIVGTVIVAAMREVRRSHPDVEFQIVEELEDTLIDDLKRGELDIAISPSVETDDLVSVAVPETLGDLVSAFARAEHPLARAGRLDLATVADAAWVLPPTETPVVRELRRRFVAQGVTPPRASVVSRSVQVVRASVLSDDLLCWMPHPLMTEDLRAGRLVRLHVPELDWPRTFRIYRRSRSLLTPVVAVLIRTLRDLQTDGRAAG